MSATDAIQASKFYLNVPTNSHHPYLEIIINWFNRLTRCVLSVLPVIGITNSFKSWAFYLDVDTLGCESITRVWARKIASILFINCTFCYKGADLFHAKILFYICTGANEFLFDVYAFFLIMGGQWSVFNENNESANQRRLCYYWLK